MSQKICNFALVIELGKHIEILLLSNDCVIVPDMGGFMAHSMDARFDDEDNMFLPPYRTLGFNPQLKMNDSLLAQSYVEAYDISYPEAMRRIESEVNELKQHLANEGYYEMNGIGMLTVNDEGHLEFEPCEAGILTPALYGLSNFEMLPLFSRREKEKEEKDKQNRIEHKARKRSTEDGDQAIVIKMSWVRNAVAAAAAVVAFFLISTPVSNSGQSDFTVNTAEIPLIPKETPKVAKVTIEKPAPVSAPKAEATPELKVEAAPEPKAEAIQPTIAAEPKAEMPKPAAIAEPKDEATPAYYIVLASQVSQKNAEAFVVTLKKRGISDARVYLYNNIRRVVCGNFRTEAEAYGRLHKVHQTEGCAEAWVYKVRSEK